MMLRIDAQITPNTAVAHDEERARVATLGKLRSPLIVRRYGWQRTRK